MQLTVDQIFYVVIEISGFVIGTVMVLVQLSRREERRYGT